MFTPPDSAFFSICGFPVYYYGVILAVAIFAGVVVSNNVAQKDYFMPAIVPSVATSLIIGGIVGARLYYCGLNYSYYISNPLEILAIREGGLAIHGAILGGALVLFCQSRRYNISFLKLCDIFAVGLPLSQAIGRWGNFFNSEAFGLPTDLPWRMYIKQPYRPDAYFSKEYFHPTFLYECILDLVIFGVIYSFIKPKYKDNAGIISAYYLVMYSFVRFFIEFLRVDCVKYVFGIAVPQVVSAVVFVIGLVFILARLKRV